MTAISVHPEREGTEGSRRLRLSLAVFFAVAGCRLLFVALWGGATPYLDECNQTGLLHMLAKESPLGIPWAWIVEPHMEHHIITQRLYSLGLAALNGGVWDVSVEMSVATFVWALISSFLFYCGSGLLDRPRLPLWALLVAFFGAFPYAWENLLWAFQVQFGLMIGFGLLALWLLSQYPALSGRWCCGLGCACLAAVSQAGGLSVLAASVLVSLLSSAKGSQLGSVRAWLGILLQAVLCLGFYLLIPPTPWHAPLAAQSAGTLIRAATSLFSWPWSGLPWMLLLLWMPGLWFALRCMRAKVEDRSAWFLIGLLAWAASLSLCAAYSRGGMLLQGLPPSRYADPLAIGILANGLAVLHWLGNSRAFRGRSLLAGLWLAALVAGTCGYTRELYYSATRATSITALSLREFVATRPLQDQAYRNYLRSHDPKDLEMTPPIYPDSSQLALVVDRLRAAKQWPLIPGAEAGDALPWLSRLARHSRWIALGCLFTGALIWASALRKKQN